VSLLPRTVFGTHVTFHLTVMALRHKQTIQAEKKHEFVTSRLWDRRSRTCRGWTALVRRLIKQGDYSLMKSSVSVCLSHISAVSCTDSASLPFTVMTSSVARLLLCRRTGVSLWCRWELEYTSRNGELVKLYTTRFTWIAYKDPVRTAQ
jgi:hypothetical protein